MRYALRPHSVIDHSSGSHAAISATCIILCHCGYAGRVCLRQQGSYQGFLFISSYSRNFAPEDFSPG
jgi:hypothetical protein